MIVPIPPAPAEPRPPPAGAGRAGADEDDALLRRLDAAELYDIHRGLDWCDRELRALGRLRPAQRRRVAALRRRWAHRWHVATGRPAVSLQAHRAWRIAAIGAAGFALVALLDGPADPAVPLPDQIVVVPPEASFPDPAPVPSPAPVAPIPSGPVLRAADDTTARAWVRRAARRLEACRRASGTLVGCDAALPAKVRQRVGISALAQSTFRIAAESGSANMFAIDRGPDGVLHRTCTVQAVRRCPAGGRW